MITVTQVRENDRTTFCRQFTFNKNGYSNRETAGAVVSGMPVAGNPVTDTPIGTILNLGYGTELYRIVHKTESMAILDPQMVKTSGTPTGITGAVETFRQAMSPEAQQIVTSYRDGYLRDEMWKEQMGNSVPGTLEWFSTQQRNSWPQGFWLTRMDASGSWPYQYVRIAANGAWAGTDFSNKPNGSDISKTSYYRPSFQIPLTTLLSPTPNPDGSYNLIY